MGSRDYVRAVITQGELAVGCSTEYAGDLTEYEEIMGILYRVEVCPTG